MLFLLWLFLTRLSTVTNLGKRHFFQCFYLNGGMALLEHGSEYKMSLTCSDQGSAVALRTSPAELSIQQSGGANASTSVDLI